MESMPWWLVLVLVLLAAAPSIILTVVLLRALPLIKAAMASWPTLLERAMDLLSSRSAEEFLRTQTSRSTSQLYSPSEPVTEPERPKSAFEQAVAAGVPDDIAQYLEED